VLVVGTELRTRDSGLGARDKAEGWSQMGEHRVREEEIWKMSPRTLEVYEKQQVSEELRGFRWPTQIIKLLKTMML
jgi:hypothetical protein